MSYPDTSRISDVTIEPDIRLGLVETSAVVEGGIKGSEFFALLWDEYNQVVMYLHGVRVVSSSLKIGH